MSLPKGPISKLEHIDVLEHHAKLFVWMHQRAYNHIWYWAVAVTVVVQLLSYAAGGVGLGSTTVSLGATYDWSVLAACFSIAAGAILGISRLKYFNFDAVAQQHAACMRDWSGFLGKLHSYRARQWLLQPGDTAARGTDFASAQDPAKTKTGDEQDQYSMLTTLYFELTSNSQEYLPMWVILACGKTFAFATPEVIAAKKLEHLPCVCQSDALIKSLESSDNDECCIACRCCCSLRCRRACGQCCVDSSLGGRSDAAKKAGGGAPPAGNTSSSQTSPGARATSEASAITVPVAPAPPASRTSVSQTTS